MMQKSGFWREASPLLGYLSLKSEDSDPVVKEHRHVYIELE